MIRGTRWAEGILRSLLLFLWAPLWVCDALAAEDGTVPTGPAPSWVIPHSVDVLSDPPKEGVSDGLWVVLSDRQINLAEETFYQHHARKLLNEGAVQNASRVIATFHPEYETLTWHKLVVHRGGSRSDRLSEHSIRILNRESNLEDHLYDGSRTAVIEVQDVRPGDIIEYAFSIKGSNPIMKGKFADILPTSTYIPIREMHVRLLEPAGREVAFRQNLPVLTLERNLTDGMTDLRWSGFNIPAVQPEGGEPSWVDLYGWLELSEFKSWADVNQWALEYYELPSVLPAELQSEIDRIRKLGSQDQQVVAALEYVQDRFRYLSVSEGVHNYKPYPIEDVVKRGFGDCKDKARLLSAMLTALGFDAKPALLNTYFRHSISDWLPSPGAFDHVVVRLNLRDKTYWLDPTMSLQRGPLSERFFPNYGRALVIESGQSRLTSIDPSGFDTTKSSIVEKFDIPSYDSPVKLVTETTYSGATADVIRSAIANTTPGDFSKNCVNFYTRFFPGIKELSPPKIEDESDKNRVRITENYEIENFWQPHPDDDRLLYGEFYASMMANDLSNPDGKLRRSHPLALSVPRNLEQTILITLPDGSKFSPQSKVIDNPAFSYRWNVEQVGRELRVRHVYNSKRDYVDAGGMDKFLSDLRAGRELGAYTIQFPKSAKSAATAGANGAASPTFEINYVYLGFLILFAILAGAGAIALYFWRPDWPPPLYPDARLTGLGGWLILPAISLFLNPIRMLIQMGSFAQCLNLEIWVKLTTPGQPAYHPLWGVTLLFETAYNLILFSVGILLLVLFFQRRKTFPPIMVGFLALMLLGNFFDGALVAAISSTVPEAATDDSASGIAQSIIGCSIWIPYFLVSRRVKSTFTR